MATIIRIALVAMVSAALAAPAFAATHARTPADLAPRLPALGTDVAAPDQQSPVTAPPARTAREGIAELPFVLSLLGAISLGVAGTTSISRVRAHRRAAALY